MIRFPIQRLPALLVVASLALGTSTSPVASPRPDLLDRPDRPGGSEGSGRLAAGLAGPVRVDHVVTALTEVQGGSVDGLDYLAIEIPGDAVGPLRCRGRLLRAGAPAGMTSERRAAMEHVALSAMLNAEVVLVTVPLAPQACLDGQPTFTRLDPLPASP